jgi:hypothetical protein
LTAGRRRFGRRVGVAYHREVIAAPRPLALALTLCACTSAGEDSETSAVTLGGTGVSTLTSGPSTTGSASETSTASASDGGTTTAADSTGTETGATDCTFCNGPNEACIDDVCVTTCEGQQPDPCGPAQVCDVISGECHAPADPCTLSGSYIACGPSSCGPGSVCNGQGECIPLAPCGAVDCLDDGTCWGAACTCERQSTCTTAPDVTALNGPFSTDIGDLEFADDCTAWMVTLRSGTDFVRRLATDGTLTEWAGVANLNMGEIKVLKALAPPPRIGPGTAEALCAAATNAGASGRLGQRPAAGVEGLGEVAITYTCCPTCGCFVDPPQGVARLVEADPNPLPIVIAALPTQGTGPFGNTPADAGPQGLTWGVDRVLYVGNSTANGELNSLDLDTGTQSLLAPLPARVTAGAAVSAAHNLLATEGGTLYLYNVETAQVATIGELGEDVTSLSHDAFSGIVYAGLRNLDVVAIRPFSADVQPFDTMPAAGRVAVSPDGQLWYVPLKIVAPAESISAWDLPDSL